MYIMASLINALYIWHFSLGDWAFIDIFEIVQFVFHLQMIDWTFLCEMLNAWNVSYFL